MPADTRIPHFRHACIVGTGLLGGSLGLALKHHRLVDHITGVGRTQNTLDTARDRGCIDATSTDLAHAVADADLIILATPIAALHRILDDLGPLDLPDTLITDVGSTKSSIVERASRVLKYPENFIGSHPMAGSEQHGPAAARADLFAGKPCVVTPTDRNDADTVEIILGLWQTIGMQVRQMSPREHDQTVARISHLPHTLAMAMVDVAAQDDAALGVASTGFADVTRVASGDPAVWADIFTDNAAAIRRMLDEHDRTLEKIRRLLDRADRDAWKQYLGEIKATRDDWIDRRDARTDTPDTDAPREARHDT